VKTQILVPCINSIPTVPVSLNGADLLAEPNGVAGDRRWDHIQRRNWENELMALLSACVARPYIGRKQPFRMDGPERLEIQSEHAAPCGQITLCVCGFRLSRMKRRHDTRKSLRIRT
jgi:hypothetical protein